MTWNAPWWCEPAAIAASPRVLVARGAPQHEQLSESGDSLLVLKQGCGEQHVLSIKVFCTGGK